PASLSAPAALRALPSFPTRRSSDLSRRRFLVAGTLGAAGLMGGTAAAVAAGRAAEAAPPDTSVIPFYGKHQAGIATSVQDRLALDRKSTRLNSSHVAISYAVFCLKK